MVQFWMLYQALTKIDPKIFGAVFRPLVQEKVLCLLSFLAAEFFVCFVSWFKMPVNISVQPLAHNNFQPSSVGATLSMVVTDMTEAHKSEELLRALTHRVLQVQEEAE